tara:strand:+ start:612 stop:743 length:132 start_codon:yes stop_codon:yes gene_type:complete
MLALLDTIGAREIPEEARPEDLLEEAGQDFSLAEKFVLIAWIT